MGQTGIKNPLELARLCSQLECELLDLGYTVNVCNDMSLLDEAVRRSRSKSVSPMHNPEVCDFSGQRAFWMSLDDPSGETVGLQAFRCDLVDTSLADWCAPYMIGIYMRCNELMVPSIQKPSPDSVANTLRGYLVYHGELWLSKATKNRKTFDCFTRLGLLLSTIKWNPDAIWGLAGEQMAKHGHPNRIGYTTIERGFLKWEWASDGIDPVEYLNVVKRQGLQQIIDEMVVSTEREFRQNPGDTTHSPSDGH
jgi:hypothetical protein